MAPHKIVVLPTFAPWRTHRPVPKWGQKGHFRTPFGTPFWDPPLGGLGPYPWGHPIWDPLGTPWDPMDPQDTPRAP